MCSCHLQCSTMDTPPLVNMIKCYSTVLMQLWDLNIEDPYQDDGCCQKVITEHNGIVKVRTKIL